jgi:RNA polymerase sigma-70 factor (ECF subfamily)
LYVEHHGWLKGWLRKKLGCSDTAADLAQDTFVRVMTARRPTVFDQPRAYLTTIARNLVVDHWRRAELEQAYVAAIALRSEPEAPSEEERLLILESLVRIDAVLHALPAVTRKIFLLSQLDGLTYADIAEQLGMSVVTVKRHMRKSFIACLSAQ